MITSTTPISYSSLLCGATNLKNISSLAREFECTRAAVTNTLPDIEESQAALNAMATDVFKKTKRLYLLIDTTMIKKVFAVAMEGTEDTFCTKTQKVLNAYTLSVAVISDGKTTIPLDCEFVFSRAFMQKCNLTDHSLADITKAMVKKACLLYSDKKIIVVCDGAFASAEMFAWARENGIYFMTRMHANRVVNFKGERAKLSELALRKKIRPKGNRMGRTISVEWKGIPLYITIERRIDKHGEESIVFLAGVYKAEAREFIATYKKRWGIEKLFRTTKLYLGLSDCQSKSLTTQHKHMMAVLVAYAQAQLIRLKYKLPTVEAALRRCQERFKQHQRSEYCLPIRSLEYAMS